MFFLILSFYAQPDNSDLYDDNLLEQFVKTKGQSAIVFDNANVKQYWIDKTVVSRDRCFEVLLNNSPSSVYTGDPLFVRLKNTYMSQDCNIFVITESPGVSFNVLDANKKVVSNSSADDIFLNYIVLSSKFHLEDTKESSFYIQFSSKISFSVKIQRIIFSFSDNPQSSYLRSPGKTKFNKDLFALSFGSFTNDHNTFSVIGKKSTLSSKKYFYLSDTPLSISGTIKNVGNSVSTIYVGYSLYSADNEALTGKNYPYKGLNNVLEVVSTKDNKIIVKGCPKWKKKAYIAYNVKEDLSDIPNFNILKGRIVEVNKIDDVFSEIVLDSTVESFINTKSKIRIHDTSGSYYYTNTQKISPGLEISINSTCSLDKDSYDFSSNVFPHGVFYVQPIILSYSDDSNLDNIISITDFIISH